MSNFTDPVRELLACGGALQIEEPENLPRALGGLFDDPDARGRLGAHGREAVIANQGAITRTLALLEQAGVR